MVRFLLRAAFILALLQCSSLSFVQRVHGAVILSSRLQREDAVASQEPSLGAPTTSPTADAALEPIQSNGTCGQSSSGAMCGA